MARETSTAPLLLILALTFQSRAWAQTCEADCPQPRTAEVAPPKPAADVPTTPVDEKDFTFDVNGNAVLSGNVVMRQGDKVIHADRLEYNAKSGQAKLTGAVEFSSPVLKVRGSSGEYSPALGAQFEGAQFELPQHNVRGAARNMKVDANGTVTLDDVSFTTCPVTGEDWKLNSRNIVI